MTSNEAAVGAGEPPQSRLRRILDESPRNRSRIGRAVAALAATALVTIAVLGILLIWHLVRRARLIRERLDPPKDVGLVDPRPDPVDE